MMETLQHIISEKYLFALGWMIVHALWQVAAIGMVLWVSLIAFSKKSAAFKYRLSVSALAMVLALAAATFFYSMPKAAPSQAASMNQSVMAGQTPAAKAAYLISTPSDWIIVSKRIENWIPMLVQVWFLGAVLFLVKLGTSLADIRNLRQKKHEAADVCWQEILQKQIRHLHLEKPVQLLKSIHVDVPMTYGIWKPVILIPASLFFQLSPVQLEAILAHELAHIKRYDYLVNLLQSFLEVLFFFHPIFWWINKIVKEQRENACDDLAISIGIAPRDLAFGLANVLNQAAAPTPEMAMAATGQAKNPTLERIKRIMGFKHRTTQPTTMTTMTMMTTLILGATLMVGASDKPTNESFEDLLATELNITTIERDWTSQLEVLRTDTVPPRDSVKVYVDFDKMSPEQKEQFKNEMKDLKDLGVFFQDMKPLLKGMSDMGKFFEDFPAAPFHFEAEPMPPFDFSMPPMPPMEFAFPDMPPMEFDIAPFIAGATDFYVWPDSTNHFEFFFDFDVDTTKMTKAEIERRKAEIAKIQAERTKKSAEAMERWTEANQERMVEWQKKQEQWEQKLRPKMEEFQVKMKAWEQENQPRIQEFQKKMEEWQKANQPKMEEFQRKMEAWQQENQVKLEQFQLKMEAWQREHQQQLEDLQKKLKESDKKGGN